MSVTRAGPFAGVLEASLRELRAAFVDVAPRAVAAVVFLVVAYVAIRVALSLVGSTLDRVYAESLVADLVGNVVAVFLWFGAVLALLKILGMGEVAASLGTATGFVALGVSYALSDMIADTVAGVYLLGDPDFNPGDTVEAADVTGTVTAIELRKTRLEVEGGDVVVVANSSVEERWTKKVGADDPAESPTGEGRDPAA